VIEYTEYEGRCPIMISLAREILEVSPEHEDLLREMIDRYKMADKQRLEMVALLMKTGTQLRDLQRSLRE
jgi:hypothetical protein